ncbi:hypothetical protein MycrhN_3313 [Mycolicibacterium rhodesiae NBB3]|uniref:Uncharacterized protein n=1 Tax=Mycolicibacterium rhodesiae (strain NBB3) TaxID=710685 RepID=G8RPV4_MYCRN|nr:hypothetical protein MycrhN_3313 [Mycolicibacterium rhodesiae NBB3]
MASDPSSSDPSSSARIIRRHPTGEIPVGADPQTSIIRRHPTGEFPTAAAGTDPQTSYIPRARPSAVVPKSPWPNPRAAIATAILSILSGWSTAVIATDLITGWWETDLLFCVAVAFLTAISAAALIAGLIGLLLRRRVSRLLIIVGAVVALMIFSSLFVAGAKLPPIVYAIPVFPVAAIVAALLPATARWARP